MPYHIIEGQPVFLHSKLYQDLENIALRDWSSSDRIGAKIAGRSKAKEADILVAKLLEENSVLEEFYSDYVLFDLVGEEAEFNIWDLLYDFCHLHQYGHLIDIRPFDEKIASDYQGEGYVFPMGQLFELLIQVQPTQQQRFLFKKNARPKSTVRIQIDTAKVSRIYGDLNDFTVTMGTQNLHFSENGIQL